ncbi:carboxypeptidase regulatory-like domain-containing protein [Otariodibacter sp.]|uniref:carboxypeptidase regulatory-like domain-containing protein n=1 Tax=Otariodibacter sp. TaxID=3030919 RepID=UPI00262761DE|nr:carboxypeptidase regulatory-like domain-containing protein [Otariodibacter sp.]
MKRLRLFILILSVLFSSNLLAHGLLVFAQYDGQKIMGKSYYTDMTPAAETYIEAYAEDNPKLLVSGKTDREGFFSLPATGDHSYKVVIEGMEGHRAETIANKVSSSEQSDNLLLIREDIAKLRDKIYLRDIIGGIGYIFGIIGLWSLWHSRSSKK